MKRLLLCSLFLFQIKKPPTFTVDVRLFCYQDGREVWDRCRSERIKEGTHFMTCDINETCMELRVVK